jgi:ribosomal protein S18 acetylase RimI-like enzyme
MATTVLQELAALTGEGRYRAAAEGALRQVAPYLARYPTGFAQWLVAADLHVGPLVEVAIIGEPADLDTVRLLRQALEGFRPRQVIACAPDSRTSAVPLLAGRFRINDRPTAFICLNFACRQPVTVRGTRRAAARANGDRRVARATVRETTARARPAERADPAAISDPGRRRGHYPSWATRRRSRRSRCWSPRRRLGQVLGGVAYVPGPGPLSEMVGDDEAGIRMLAVAPEAQGRGVGRALAEACIERARAAGRRRIVLLTMPSMTVAQRLYLSLGFARDSANDWEYEPGHVLWGFALEL